MSDRKETPDLLGDILANRQDDRSVNKQQITTTVSEASNRFTVSDRTIRTWAAEFADYLSTGANPGKGEVRAFTQDDMTVLATIARLRSHKVSYKEIQPALKADLQADPIAGAGVAADSAQVLIGEQPPAEVQEQQAVEEMETSPLVERESPPSSDSVPTLEDQLKQLGVKKHWWQVWRPPNRKQ
jgi:DNA-binding transcriptional MerR regulator